MRIAQIAPLTEAIPPKFYGGTERVVSWLTEELVALGCRPSLCLTVRHHLPRLDHDALLGARISEALGLRQVLLDQNEPRLKAELRKSGRYHVETY